MLADGTELPADLVVYATGYGSMNGWVGRPHRPGRRPTGRQGVGARLGHDQGPRPVGGRAAQHVEADPAVQALWFHGGNLHQSRHYSLYLALQLKARAEGIDTPVYGLQEVHHTS